MTEEDLHAELAHIKATIASLETRVEKWWQHWAAYLALAVGFGLGMLVGFWV